MRAERLVAALGHAGLGVFGEAGQQLAQRLSSTLLLADVVQRRQLSRVREARGRVVPTVLGSDHPGQWPVPELIVRIADRARVIAAKLLPIAPPVRHKLPDLAPDASEARDAVQTEPGLVKARPVVVGRVQMQARLPALERRGIPAPGQRRSAASGQCEQSQFKLPVAQGLAPGVLQLFQVVGGMLALGHQQGEVNVRLLVEPEDEGGVGQTLGAAAVALILASVDAVDLGKFVDQFLGLGERDRTQGGMAVARGYCFLDALQVDSLAEQDGGVELAVPRHRCDSIKVMQRVGTGK